MLNIIGGSYIEHCIDPVYNELFGSGLRAACALSKRNIDISFHTCICEDYKFYLELKARTFGFDCSPTLISQTIEFYYYHPLSRPEYESNTNIQCVVNNEVSLGCVLYYGLVEATFKFNGDYVVYDPQNHKRFIDTGSSAKHLALVLNKKEAALLSKIDSDEINEIGKRLLKTENAEVVIIKNGSYGAFVFEKNTICRIPVFENSSVWPIGSGDIFTATFAWQWMIEKKTPSEAAYIASKHTAQFCQSQQLPLSLIIPSLKPIDILKSKRSIYIAGPFFSIGERWLINEIRKTLLEFGNDVFSPFHDVGLTDTTDIRNESQTIAKLDLDGLKKCDTVLAVFSGLDAGTIFEIGYAIALEKRVVLLSENVNVNDLTMFIGSNCQITSDFSTAIYKASW